MEKTKDKTNLNRFKRINGCQNKGFYKQLLYHVCKLHKTLYPSDKNIQKLTNKRN